MYSNKNSWKTNTGSFYIFTFKSNARETWCVILVSES